MSSVVKVYNKQSKTTAVLLFNSQESANKYIQNLDNNLTAELIQ
jgi:hypothetical protein